MSNDAELIELAGRGDSEAWRKIVERYESSLRATAATFRLSADDVSDAVQLTWLCAYTHIASLRDPSRLGQWLRAITRNQCLAIVTSRHRSRELCTGDWSHWEHRDETCDVEDEVIRQETGNQLKVAIGRLSGREQRLAALLVTEAPSYADVSKRLEMPIGSIGPTRERACKHLRVILEQMDAGLVPQAA
jgi:RNA polymerase sigma factor (sigma-70 family)